MTRLQIIFHHLCRIKLKGKILTSFPYGSFHYIRTDKLSFCDYFTTRTRNTPSTAFNLAITSSVAAVSISNMDTA